jgi:carbon storage regulator
MLVLSRRLDESIWIGDDVRLTILQIQNNRVRLGIDAPQNVAIRRSELPPIDEIESLSQLRGKPSTANPSERSLVGLNDAFDLQT